MAAPARTRDAAPGDAGAAPGGGTTRHQKETVLLSELAIRRVDPARPVELMEDVLARELGMMLAATDEFAANADDVPAGRVAAPARLVATITYDVVDGGPAKGKGIVVAVEAEIEWQAGDRLAPRENVLVERALAAGDEKRLDALVSELVLASLLQAGKGLVDKEALRQADDADVIAAVGSGDSDRMAWALDLVADRRLVSALDAVVAQLDSGEPAVRDAALRALVALGDARAVGPLVKRADFRDPERMKTIVEAVTAIGGDEAVDFLEMVATGHSDRDMRERAAEGLERLKRRNR